MIYDEIAVGDVLEWKLMANQSKTIIVVKIEEEIVVLTLMINNCQSSN